MTGDNSCHCSKVTIKCLDDNDLQNGAIAECKRKACEIRFKKKTCTDLGYKNDQEIDPTDFDASLPNYGTFLPIELAQEYMASHIQSECAKRHEGKHICDGPDMRSCQTEVNAYALSLACEQHYYDTYCSTITTVNLKFCQDLRAAVNLDRAAGDFNACICQGNDGLLCYDRCKAENNAFSDECRKIFDTYHRG